MLIQCWQQRQTATTSVGVSSTAATPHAQMLLYHGMRLLLQHTGRQGFTPPRKLGSVRRKRVHGSAGVCREHAGCQGFYVRPELEPVFVLGEFVPLWSVLLYIVSA